eukprot:gene9767-1161_t
MVWRRTVKDDDGGLRKGEAGGTQGARSKGWEDSDGTVDALVP